MAPWLGVVIRRVGGLEVLEKDIRMIVQVIRRVGGLEVATGPKDYEHRVIRRVGGLEGVHER